MSSIVESTSKPSPGGRVDLSGVQQIVDTDQGDTRNRSVDVLADGVASQVDLSSLVNFNDPRAGAVSGNDRSSTITASNFGIVTLNATQTVLVGVTTSETNNGMIVGQFGLRVAGGENANAAGGLQALSNESLTLLVDVAFAQWVEAGIATDAGSRLASVEFHVVGLPSDYLGHTSATTIFLDPYAAGYGWFIDATPWDDEEFDEQGRAIAGSAAEGRVDLLTVVLHELGHVLGLDHDDDPDSLMDDLLGVGQRRHFSLEVIDHVLELESWR